MSLDKKYRVPKTAITEKGLKRLLKKAARQQGSIGGWARDHDITPQAVSAFLNDRQGAGLQVPEALGYRPQVVFLPLGEELIAHMNPPRKVTQNPTKKVDHTKEPIEKTSKSRTIIKDRLKNRTR